MISVFGKDIPVELYELVRPASTALIVIDMQNDYCSPAGAAAKTGGDLSGFASLTTRIRAFTATCREVGVSVFFTQNIRLPDGRSDSPAWLRLRMRAAKDFTGEHPDIFGVALRGTWGAELIAELQPKPGDHLITKFRSTSAAPSRGATST